MNPERRNRGLATLVLLLIGFAYLITASRHVLGGDNGEFATIFATGGVAHPSGYPLYVLYLRMFSWIPFVSPAHGAAILTALLGIGTAGLVYVAARSWNASALSAGVAMAVYALSPLSWSLATHAEVFTLHAFMCASILIVASPKSPVRGVAGVCLLGALAGLALSNHLTAVLLAPIGLYGAWVRMKESPHRIRTVLLGVACLVLGLLPYLQVLFVAPSGGMWVWGEGVGIDRILHHMLRVDYGTTQLSGEGQAAPIAQLQLFTTNLLRDWMWAFGVIALLGAGLIIRTTEDRVFRIVLVFSFLLMGPVFVLFLNIPPDGIGAHVVERFHLMPRVALAVILALTIEIVVQRYDRIRAFETPLVVAVACVMTISSLATIVDRGRSDVDAYLRDTLWWVEEGAVVMGSGDHRLFGFLYIQEALGIRTDVVYIDPRMLHYPWYQTRIEDQTGLALRGITPGLGDEPGNVSTVTLVDQFLLDGRAVYLTNVVSPVLIQTYPSYPTGTLIRLAIPGSEMPDPLSVEAENAEFWRTATLPTGVPLDSTGWQASVRADYARPWFALATIFGRAGYPEKEQRLNETGRSIIE